MFIHCFFLFKVMALVQCPLYQNPTHVLQREIHVDYQKSVTDKKMVSPGYQTKLVNRPTMEKSAYKALRTSHETTHPKFGKPLSRNLAHSSGSIFVSLIIF